MLRQRQPRVKDDKHRVWLSTLPCCVSGVHGQSQVAHIRYQTGAGMGMKSSDNFCIPLSWAEHNKQHNHKGGEVGYWEEHGGIERAKELANALHVRSTDTDYALMLIRRFMKK